MLRVTVRSGSEDDLYGIPATRTTRNPKESSRTSGATGKRLDLPFVDVLKARGEKFCLLHVYFDRLEMMSQLGVIPGRR